VTAPAQPQPTENRDIVTPRDRFLADRTERECWFEERDLARQPVNTTTEKRAEHQTDQEAENNQGHLEWRALQKAAKRFYRRSQRGFTEGHRDHEGRIQKEKTPDRPAPRQFRKSTFASRLVTTLSDGVTSPGSVDRKAFPESRMWHHRKPQLLSFRTVMAFGGDGVQQV
jgi:hypothetical protein